MDWNTLAVAIGTIVGTAAILVIRDLRDGKSIFKRNGSYEAAQTMKQLLESIKRIGDSQGQLQLHFNHDTTRLLTEIRDSMSGCARKIDVMLNKQDEIMKYGVPTRNP